MQAHAITTHSNDALDHANVAASYGKLARWRCCETHDLTTLCLPELDAELVKKKVVSRMKCGRHRVSWYISGVDDELPDAKSEEELEREVELRGHDYDILF